jgi:hypothetical protein
MRVQTRSWLLGAVAVFLLAGCGTVNVGLVPPEQMAPRELAVYAMGAYNSAYDSYMAKATLPDLSSAEKKILKVQRESLTQAFPIIKTFSWFVDHNQIPPAEMRLQLLQWLNSVRY